MLCVYEPHKISFSHSVVTFPESTIFQNEVNISGINMWIPPTSWNLTQDFVMNTKFFADVFPEVFREIPSSRIPSENTLRFPRILSIVPICFSRSFCWSRHAKCHESVVLLFLSQPVVRISIWLKKSSSLRFLTVYFPEDFKYSQSYLQGYYISCIF